MRIVLIDNYDSFTFNLAQYIREQEGVKLTILKNDAFLLSDLATFDKIVISPGPGLPTTAGLMMEVISSYSGKMPILGVCLGLQAIYESFGGSLFNLPTVQHGVTSVVEIIDKRDPLFQGVPNPFNAGRYHSWICERLSLPESLSVSAVDESGNIMACKHNFHATYGLQFHPESILTPDGKQMIKNFVSL